MNVPFYDIKAQYDELKEQMDASVHEVLSTGAYVMGKNHNALEKSLAEMHGCKHGIAVNSGTDALRIMMDAVGIKAGDEVITTAFTFVASVETIIQTGATPVFVDIDPATFQMDPDKIVQAITPKTKAILPIHLFGQLCDITRIKAIADAHGLILLEDAAQALNSHLNGVHAGNFGVAAGFSFYVTKNLGAAGDGGLIMTNSDEIAETCKSMRVHGMGRERYYYDHLGYTSRLAELQAAVLVVKLTKLMEWNARRADLSKIYQEVLAGSGVTLPAVLPGNNHTYHQYTIRSTDRDALQNFLKEKGVASMIYYPVPIHFHSPYAHLAQGKGSLPETELAAEQVLSLPIHPHLNPDQVRYAAECVKEFAGVAVGV